MCFPLGNWVVPEKDITSENKLKKKKKMKEKKKEITKMRKNSLIFFRGGKP